MAAAFAEQALAQPDKPGAPVIDLFGDAPAQSVIEVLDFAAFRQGDSCQPVLAVIAVMAHQTLTCAASLLDQVAVGVVHEMAVALYEQAVAFDIGRAAAPPAAGALAQQVTGRVMLETFFSLAPDCDQPPLGVVAVTLLAMTAIAKQAQTAAGVVLVMAAVERPGTEAMVGAAGGDGMLLQSSLLVVAVLAVQVALLAGNFAAGFELVFAEAFAIEVNGAQASAFLIVIDQLVAVWQVAGA